MSGLADAWEELDEQLTEIDGAELVRDNVDPTLPDRMLRAVARERRKIAEAEAIVEAEKERLDAYLQQVRARHDTSYLEAALAGYHEARLARDPRAKTIHLPSGDLTARKQPDQWDIDDETFLQWAQRAGRAEFLRTKVEVDRQTARKRLLVKDGQVITDDAELVPGVRVEPGGVRFTVKISEDLT